MTWQQRAIYVELLGHCHMDNGIPNDKRVLIGKLGLTTDEEKADLETVLKEFEGHEEKDGWLMHPRTDGAGRTAECCITGQAGSRQAMERKVSAGVAKTSGIDRQ